MEQYVNSLLLPESNWEREKMSPSHSHWERDEVEVSNGGQWAGWLRILAPKFAVLTAEKVGMARCSNKVDWILEKITGASFLDYWFTAKKKVELFSP